VRACFPPRFFGLFLSGARRLRCATVRPVRVRAWAYVQARARARVALYLWWVTVAWHDMASSDEHGANGAGAWEPYAPA
jgi:hypothetical protein